MQTILSSHSQPFTAPAGTVLIPPGSASTIKSAPDPVAKEDEAEWWKTPSVWLVAGLAGLVFYILFATRNAK